MDRRYISEDFTARKGLPDLAALVKHAWSMALIDPLLGDEIITDLCGDIEAIVSREARRTETEAQAAADASAEAFWLGRVQRAYRHATDLVASLASAALKDGIDPLGYYVYLLWPHKGAEKPVYVGRSINLFARIGQHMADPEKRYRATWVTVMEAASEQDMIDTELKLIARYQPELNTLGCNGGRT